MGIFIAGISTVFIEDSFGKAPLMLIYANTIAKPTFLPFLTPFITACVLHQM